MPRPVRIRKTPAIVDAHARFVRVEVVRIDEANVIGRDDRQLLLAGEQQACLHGCFFVTASLTLRLYPARFRTPSADISW